MSISKNQLKLVKSLHLKKFRQKHQLFIAEGIKVVNELLKSSIELDTLFTTDKYEFEEYEIENVFEISESELKKISNLKTPNKVLGLFKIPAQSEIVNSGLIIALDGVNDPGNLGTIIRLCDWFGVDQLICSKDTVDCFNQKVVQSTMGSLSRLAINYVDLKSFIENAKIPSFIADMDGENIYKSNLPKEAILVMGNEANGVSEVIKTLINNKISIPRFGNIQQTESLNVATATAIVLSEFRRNI